MTEVGQVNQEFLDLKLKLLERHRGHVHHTVDDFVNNIVSLAKQWADNQEGKPQIYELLQAIDRAVELLVLKCEEMSENATKQINVDRICNLKSSQEIDKDTELTIFKSEMLKWHKKQEKRLDANEEAVKAINAKVGTAQTKIKNMKEQLKQLSENQATEQDRTRIIEDMEERFVDLSNETEFLKHFVKAASDKNKSSMENVLTRTDSLENAATDLSEKFIRSEESIETILAKQKRCAVEIEDIAKKLVMVEERDGTFEDLQKQYEEVDEKFRIVCQMLVTKLKPLEKLQQTLNGSCRTRDENVAQLQELVKEVAIMSPRIDQLEIQRSKTVVGFTARKSDVQTIAQNSIITLYNLVLCNIGDHFDPATGIFTVPCDGTYVVSVTLMTPNYGYALEVDLICCDALVYNGQHRNVCWAVSRPNEARYCDLGLIEMKTGDILFAEVTDQGSNVSKDKSVRISCFMIG